MSEAPYLSDLNAEQRKAVTTLKGPLLVLAGAGSGKTKVITHRIVHLIHEGVTPHNILAVTFTNKAAKEMRERVLTLIQQFPPTRQSAGESSPMVTTFHSLGVRILREHHAALDLKKHFSIYDRSDSLRAMKQAIVTAGYNPKEFEPRRILSIVSRAKGDALSRVDFNETAETYPEKVAALAWEHYDLALKAEDALDFDDLLLKTLNLLKSHPEVLKIWQERFHYLHIDEYQDTNRVQYEIARLLTGDRLNICAVGDIDQNVYSWRGADIKNIMQFEKHFAGTHVVLLEQNYRSTKTIIGAANSVIKNNKERVDKNVFTDNQTGEALVLYPSLTGRDEAEYVAMTAKELIGEGTAPSEIAVLFRTNFQSRVLEEAFLNFDLPYQVLGTKFFERKEVKDVLSYLRLALNPGSNADLARVINMPPRGIGKVTLLKLIEGRRGDMTAGVLKKVTAFEEMMMDIAKKAREERLSKTIKFIIKITGTEKHYKEAGTEDDLSRLENLRELVTLALRYDEHEPEVAVGLLLEDAALQSDQDELQAKEEKDAVRLMTVHAAKGLEFPYVFITGLEEGLFPHERLDDSKIDNEEERRLFYVALTRAHKKVWLTYANTRMIFGSERVNLPSSFLSEIDSQYLKLAASKDHQSGYEQVIEID